MKLNINFSEGNASRSFVYDDSKAALSVEEINSIIDNLKFSSHNHECCHGNCGGEEGNDSITLPPFPKEYQQSNKEERRPPQNNVRDHYGIRERLPNNVVDVSELTVQKAITDSALIRCPHCGQAHAVIISDGTNLYLMRKHYSTNEFGIIKDAPGTDESSILYLSCNGDTPEDKLSYFYQLQGMPLTEDKDFAVTNDMELFCPVCHKSAPFIHWKEAWQSPLQFFETEHRCEACGGECIERVDSDKSGISVCEACKKKWLNDGSPSMDKAKEDNDGGD